jgi:hypothetical protein
MAKEFKFSMCWDILYHNIQTSPSNHILSCNFILFNIQFRQLSSPKGTFYCLFVLSTLSKSEEQVPECKRKTNGVAQAQYLSYAETAGIFSVLKVHKKRPLVLLVKIV